MLTSTTTDIPTYTARRIVSVNQRGSSRPAIIETDAGMFFTKLRGAAQGTPALIAEIIVAGLAEALDLWIPSRALIDITPSCQCDIHEDEFIDLLRASYGLNLGFQYLHQARDIGADEIATLNERFVCTVLWLDALVMNVDRTLQNPNLMRSHSHVWVIDHGAALPFQYSWSTVVEDAPRYSTYPMERHIFWQRANQLDVWDTHLAAKLSRSVLQSVICQIPDCFLQPLLPSASAHTLERRRQAYGAFLWKRLKSPRPFMNSWANQRKK
ncbi:MAG: HipA family kinase [Cyanobacteria bacterium P01_H01_bin.21]